jgi:hypothetical protein
MSTILTIRKINIRTFDDNFISVKSLKFKIKGYIEDFIL